MGAAVQPELSVSLLYLPPITLVRDKHKMGYFPPLGEGFLVPKTYDRLVTDHFNSNQLVKKRKWRKRIN